MRLLHTDGKRDKRYFVCYFSFCTLTQGRLTDGQCPPLQVHRKAKQNEKVHTYISYLLFLISYLYLSFP